MKKIFLLMLFCLFCAAAVPAAAQAQDAVQQTEVDLDDYGDEEAGSSAQKDSLSGWNRFWFGFNDFMIRYVAKPVHKCYAFIVPKPIRNGIATFSHNLLFPVRMVNSLLQGEFAQAGVEFDRSLVNFMLSLGFADPAGEKKPLYAYRPETMNFDFTLARWGVPDGPYIVWPFLGPSTVRGTFGMAGDSAMKPQTYVLDWPYDWGSTAFLKFNSFDDVYKAYDTITGSALEPYAALRNGFLESRKKFFEDNLGGSN